MKLSRITKTASLCLMTMSLGCSPKDDSASENKKQVVVSETKESKTTNDKSDHKNKGLNIRAGDSGAQYVGVGVMHKGNGAQGTGSQLKDIERCVMTASHVVGDDHAKYFSTDEDPYNRNNTSNFEELRKTWTKSMRWRTHPTHIAGNGVTNENVMSGFDLGLVWLKPFSCSVQTALTSSDPVANPLTNCEMDSLNKTDLNTFKSNPKHLMRFVLANPYCFRK